MVNRSASDKTYGDKWTVHEVVRNAVTAPSSMVGLAGHELVAVKMTMTAGTVFYAGIQTESFKLIPDKPQQYDGSETSDILTKQMTAAGLTPVMPGTVDTGKSVTGWMLFNLKTPGSKTLTLEYTQQAAQTLSGKAVPAQKVDLKLIP